MIEEGRLPAGAFDAVVLLDVVEHLLDPALGAGPVAGGAARRRLPAAVHPELPVALSRLGMGTAWAVLSPHEHLYYFTETTLRRTLEKAGFREVSFPPNPAGGTVYDTLNPLATHEPGSARSRVWRWVVDQLGPSAAAAVQRHGRADALLAWPDADSVLDPEEPAAEAFGAAQVVRHQPPDRVHAVRQLRRVDDRVAHRPGRVRRTRKGPRNVGSVLVVDGVTGVLAVDRVPDRRAIPRRMIPGCGVSAQPNTTSVPETVAPWPGVSSVPNGFVACALSRVTVFVPRSVDWFRPSVA